MFKKKFSFLIVILFSLEFVQFAVLHVLGGLSTAGKVMPGTVDMLTSAKLQLRKLLVSSMLFFLLHPTKTSLSLGCLNVH